MVSSGLAAPEIAGLFARVRVRLSDYLTPAIARNPALDFCHQPSLCEPLKTPAPRLERDRRRDEGDGRRRGRWEIRRAVFKTAETPPQRIFSSRLHTGGRPCLLRELLARPRWLPAMPWLRRILCTPRQRLEFSSACPG